MGGLLNLSAWIRPFGFVRTEHETESELTPGAGELDLATYAVLAVLDVISLPLAVFWLAGVGRSADADGQR
jgi:hypothetical protein